MGPGRRGAPGRPWPRALTARGGPEFDCGQPRRHPFTMEGGLGPAEAGPPSFWRVRAGGGCLLARSYERVPATRRPIQSDRAGPANQENHRARRPTDAGSLGNGLAMRLPSSELRAHSRPGETMRGAAGGMRAAAGKERVSGPGGENGPPRARRSRSGRAPAPFPVPSIAALRVHACSAGSRVRWRWR